MGVLKVNGGLAENTFMEMGLNQTIKNQCIGQRWQQIKEILRVNGE